MANCWGGPTEGIQLGKAPDGRYLQKKKKSQLGSSLLHIARGLEAGQFLLCLQQQSSHPHPSTPLSELRFGSSLRTLSLRLSSSGSVSCPIPKVSSLHLTHYSFLVLPDHCPFHLNPCPPSSQEVHALGLYCLLPFLSQSAQTSQSSFLEYFSTLLMPFSLKLLL